ncbi:hypothetical protein ACLKA6_008671 [Drosophila palustris]
MTDIYKPIQYALSNLTGTERAMADRHWAAVLGCQVSKVLWPRYDSQRTSEILRFNKNRTRLLTGVLSAVWHSGNAVPTKTSVAAVGTKRRRKVSNTFSVTVLAHFLDSTVNNLELIREVLNKNGKFFGGRPDFLRYHKLFGGDRNNSLALCDWSLLQQKRRNLARRHCSPRESSSYFAKMSRIGCEEIDNLMQRMRKVITPGEPFDIKPLILKTCANMFSQYMCSMRFDYEDTEFHQVVQYFDEIFYEINQGYPLDFLPIGKRTCIGQNLVRGFGFIMLANIMQSYNINSVDLSTITISSATVALPAVTFPLVLTPRT